MRSCASRHSRGFTLLELVLAMACSAILVALLVSVWIQVMRSSTAVMGEAAVFREREVERRDLQRLLHTLRWSATSHVPGGVMPWEEGQGRVTVWSGESGGRSAGPVRWTFEAQGEGLKSVVLDPLDPVTDIPSREWAQLRSLRLETLSGSLQGQGEELRWIPFSQWDPSRPFRPLAIRLWIRWKGQDIEECIATTL